MDEEPDTHQEVEGSEELTNGVITDDLTVENTTTNQDQLESAEPDNSIEDKTYQEKNGVEANQTPSERGDAFSVGHQDSSAQETEGRDVISPRTHTLMRMSSLTPSRAEFGRIPSAPKSRRVRDGSAVAPTATNTSVALFKTSSPKAMKMSTVSMSARAKDTHPVNYYNNYVETKLPKKVITWSKATNARPPLRIDMEGPTPCSYTPGRRPPMETSAPSWSFGQRFVEKEGGSRTSWEKTWFQSSDVWCQKTDFLHEKNWPAPATYRSRPIVGKRHVTGHGAPSYTMGRRGNNKTQSETEPAPGDYDRERADSQRFTRTPAYSHSFREGGTVLWGQAENTPGPGAYDMDVATARNKSHHPSYSIRSLRRENLQHQLGPFAAF